VIDTHCHLLAGVDDGPRTDAEALRLARKLVAEGVTTVLCTPHFSDQFPTPVVVGQKRHERLRAELELVGGIRGRFSGATDVADLDEALADVPHLIDRGFTSICFKPSMFTDDRDAVPDICRRVVGRLAAAS